MRAALRTLVYVAAMVGLITVSLPYIACGPSAQYEAGIPPDRGDGFLFYARDVAQTMGHRAWETLEGQAVNVEIDGVGRIGYTNDLERGIVVSLHPDGEDSVAESNIATLRQRSDEIIARARERSKENIGF